MEFLTRKHFYSLCELFTEQVGRKPLSTSTHSTSTHHWEVWHKESQKYWCWGYAEVSLLKRNWLLSATEFSLTRFKAEYQGKGRQKLSDSCLSTHGLHESVVVTKQQATPRKGVQGTNYPSSQYICLNPPHSSSFPPKLNYSLHRSARLTSFLIENLVNTYPHQPFPKKGQSSKKKKNNIIWLLFRSLYIFYPLEELGGYTSKEHQQWNSHFETKPPESFIWKPRAHASIFGDVIWVFLFTAFRLKPCPCF